MIISYLLRRNYELIVFYHFCRRWWCHFDDDNYVHISQLILLLKRYSSSKIAYLGKPSTAKPLEIFDDSAMYSVRTMNLDVLKKKCYLLEYISIVYAVYDYLNPIIPSTKCFAFWNSTKAKNQDDKAHVTVRNYRPNVDNNN